MSASDSELRAPQAPKTAVSASNRALSARGGPAVEPSKVVATIAPPETDEQRARADYAAVWRELIETKAKLAGAMNELSAQARAFKDLERYVQRHVKRLDAVASRLERARDAR